MGADHPGLTRAMLGRDPPKEIVQKALRKGAHKRTKQLARAFKFSDTVMGNLKRRRGD